MMYNPMLLKVWLACNVSGGLVGVPILVITLYLSGLKRLKTLYNLFFTWIFSTLISSLLFFVHRAMPSDPPPHYVLCLLQASMIYGVPPLTALSALALIYDTWIVITGRALPPNHPVTVRRNFILLSIPWLCWTAIATASLFVGVFDGHDLGRSRRFFYCSYKNNYLTNLIAITTGFIILATAVLTFATVWKLYKYWKDIKAMVDDPSAAEHAMGSSYVILRIGIFGINLFLTLALSFISIASPRSPIPDIFAATLSISVVVIFGTQWDIVLAWVAGIRWIYNRVLGRHRPPNKPDANLPSPRDAVATRPPGDVPVTVDPPNTSTVWKDQYLDKRTPPTSVRVEEDSVMDDFEEFWETQKSMPAEQVGKPLPPLPMSSPLPPGLA